MAMMEEIDEYVFAVKARVAQETEINRTGYEPQKSTLRATIIYRLFHRAESHCSEVNVVMLSFLHTVMTTSTRLMHL